MMWTITIQEDPSDANNLILPLPDDLTETLGWKEGDILEWDIQQNGSIILRKRASNMKIMKIMVEVTIEDFKQEWGDSMPQQIKKEMEEFVYLFSPEAGKYFHKFGCYADAEVVNVTLINENNVRT